MIRSILCLLACLPAIALGSCRTEPEWDPSHAGLESTYHSSSGPSCPSEFDDWMEPTPLPDSWSAPPDVDAVRFEDTGPELLELLELHEASLPDTSSAAETDSHSDADLPADEDSVADADSQGFDVPPDTGTDAPEDVLAPTLDAATEDTTPPDLTSDAPDTP